MKGYLKKTESGWFVVYDQRTMQDPSAEDGILPLHPKNASYLDMNLTSTTFLNKEIEFEEIALVDKLDSYQNCVFKTYAEFITTDSKKDRTCNHTNCREICPECKLPSDILKNVISSQPDWNEEPLNSFGEDCEAVKNWDSFVEQKNNELEVEKLAELESEVQGWGKYEGLSEQNAIKESYINGFNKAKEYFYTKQDLIDLVESLKNYTKESHTILGHDDREPIEFVDIFINEISDEEALSLVKKLNKQQMTDSQFTISDDVLFEQATVAMEEVYGYGCETEIDAYFRGLKWMQKQFNKQD